MERVILHSDLNNFYASVECLYNPEIRQKPVAVCGKVEERHGIVLAKNQIAKLAGVMTGEAVWQAKKKCPDIVIVPPDMKKYLQFSQYVSGIYSDYTDMIEPFGLDESWLDVTDGSSFGDGKKIADQIRERIRFELGITASVGVSFNKIFSKLASDIKKPDATTVISKDNFKDKIFSLSAGSMLYVGRTTYKKIKSYGIETIGDMANADCEFLMKLLGKWGFVLWNFANGFDTSHVRKYDQNAAIKSVGNSTTTPMDLENDLDIKEVLYVLCESVAARLREYGVRCRTVQINVRDKDLRAFERQAKLYAESCITSEIFELAFKIFEQNYKWERPVRSIGVRGCDLVTDESVQLSVLLEDQKSQKLEILERTVDKIRDRFGYFSIKRGINLEGKFSALNPKEDHLVVSNNGNFTNS